MADAGRTSRGDGQMSEDEARKSRLASALRANLARRKVQGRARSASEAAQTSDASAEAEPAAPCPPPRRIVPEDGAG